MGLGPPELPDGFCGDENRPPDSNAVDNPPVPSVHLEPAFCFLFYMRIFWGCSSFLICFPWLILEHTEEPKMMYHLHLYSTSLIFQKPLYSYWLIIYLP